MASTSVVLPWSTWAMIAMLRRSARLWVTRPRVGASDAGPREDALDGRRDAELGHVEDIVAPPFFDAPVPATARIGVDEHLAPRDVDDPVLGHAGGRVDLDLHARRRAIG